MKYVVMSRPLVWSVLMIMTKISSAQTFIRGRKAAVVVDVINNSSVYETPPFSVSIHVNTSSGGCEPGILKCEDGYACCAIHMPREWWWCCSVSEKCGDARGQCLRPNSNNHVSPSQQRHDPDDDISVDVQSTADVVKQDVVIGSAHHHLNVSQTIYPPNPPRRHRRHHTRHKHGH
jgi:hypothetical protein